MTTACLEGPGSLYEGKTSYELGRRLWGEKNRGAAPNSFTRYFSVVFFITHRCISR